MWTSKAPILHLVQTGAKHDKKESVFASLGLTQHKHANDSNVVESRHCFHFAQEQIRFLCRKLFFPNSTPPRSKHTWLLQGMGDEINLWWFVRCSVHWDYSFSVDKLAKVDLDMSFKLCAWVVKLEP